MELTRSLVTSKAEEYQEIQPFALVEEEHREILPAMLTRGEFGWRDVEWVVQWYFRRYLGAYPDRERRKTEEAFGTNSYEDVMTALSTATDADTLDEKLTHLLALEGVDTEVASAFLFFIYPETYIVVGNREWVALRTAGRLDGAYPDPLSTDDYHRYHDVCQQVAVELDVDIWTLYRALWRLGTEHVESTQNG